MEFAESEANGKEQVVIFNFDSKHAKVLPIFVSRINQLNWSAQESSLLTPVKFWAGGSRDTLTVDSRPQDDDLIKAFLVGGAK
jgi:hypothetical protein